ncbi:hypothetical protein N7520_002921 [Penicillium odoratum]|uniref:uncharacterized protein n=1 Tax=Penicillium odoratum TaxID=1167516 RepID=UPI0025472488|nr:uncharacterized protein N7520_002921 [Penicillium odoratum]KAJ5772392.1 hypothetical protein N7520_002921 [Penicillium odoratum]
MDLEAFSTTRFQDSENASPRSMPPVPKRKFTPLRGNPRKKSRGTASADEITAISLTDVPIHVESVSPSPSPLTELLETPSGGTASDRKLSFSNSDSTENLMFVKDDSEEVLSANEDESSSSCDDEPLPDAPIYDEGLQRGLRDVINHLTRLMETIRISELMLAPISDLSELLPEMEKLGRFQYPQTRTVGFIGTSGEGKSSVINSLLDKDNLSRASGAGTACTSVVTEFRYIDDSHPGPYTIEALFMNSEEITELLEELLRSYRVYRCESSFRDLTSAEEREKLRDTAISAEETLQSLFNNQPGWNLEFLQDETEGAEKVILVKLKKWAEIAVSLRPGDHDSLVYTTVAKNLDRCKERIDDLVADTREDGEPALWPFIRLIRVYLKSQILRTGLVVTDLPGFRDLNYARVRATDKYLSHNCDEVFIVSSIGRCCSDLSIPDIMRRCENKPRHIVCTRSDAIFPQEEARGRTAYAAKMCRINKKLKDLSAQLRNASKSAGARHNAGELRLRVEDVKFNRTQFMIETRNDRVKHTLKESHAGIGVFCVSNTLYTKHRNGDYRQFKEFVSLSGIRELRTHCQMIPATAQLHMTMAYLNHQVPALLGSLLLAQIETIIRRDILAPYGCIEHTKRELIDLFEADILKLIGESEVAWTENCLKVSGEWSVFNHATYTAFCRRNGDFKSSSSSVGPRVWNEELIQHPQAQLSPHWETIYEWLESQTSYLTGTISLLFEQICAIIRLYEIHAPQSLGNLLTCMKNRQQNVNHKIEPNKRYLGPRHWLRQKRKNAMYEHLKNPNLFSKYSNLTEAVYTEAVDENFDALEANIREQVNKIGKDLKNVFGRKVNLEGELPLADTIKAELDIADKLLERAHLDLASATRKQLA